ncbi:MAG: MFS transporter [Euzebyaceae bacterium]|nr:MFS transporter [Euzebyaceae bacterium]
MTPPAPDRRRPWSIVALLVAQGVSVTGNRISLLALPWFVLETTGSATRTGLVAAANVLPMVVAGALAGPLIDRVGLQRTSVAADLASGATIALIPLLHGAGVLSFGGLIALVLAGALLDAPGETARRALIPDLAARAGMPLTRATSLHETTFRLTLLLGGPLAGLLIATVGATDALLVDAVTFAASAALIATVGRVAAHRGSEDPGNYLKRLREGWSFLRRDPLMPSFLGVFMAANVLENALMAVLLPVYAERVLGSATALGLMVGAVGAGAVTGALLYGAFGTGRSRRSVLLPALAVAGAPKYLLLAGAPPAAVAIAGLGLAALAIGPVNPISGAVQLERIPAELRGRVVGLVTASVTATIPVGLLAAGWAVEAVGLRATLLVGAVAYALTTAVPFVHPAWRRLDDAPVPRP